MAIDPVPHQVAGSQALGKLIPTLAARAAAASHPSGAAAAGMMLAVLRGVDGKVHATSCLDERGMRTITLPFGELADAKTHTCLGRQPTTRTVGIATLASLLTDGIPNLYTLALAEAALRVLPGQVAESSTFALLDELRDQAAVRLSRRAVIEPYLLSVAFVSDPLRRLQTREPGTGAETVWQAHRYVQTGAGTDDVASRYGADVASQVTADQRSEARLLDVDGHGWLARAGWRRSTSVVNACHPSFVEVERTVRRLLASDVVGDHDGRAAYRLPRWVIDPLNNGRRPADVCGDLPRATVETALVIWTASDRSSQLHQFEAAVHAAGRLVA